MTTEPLILDGCTPTPLASYLKALGILRLISSDANHVSGRAADPAARGWWEHERFCLRTTLDRDSLCQFFLTDYAPSPIIAPWNGRAGFLEGDTGEESSRTGAELVRAIEYCGSPRFWRLQQTVRLLRSNEVLHELDSSRAKEKHLNTKLKVIEGDERDRAKEELSRAKRQSAELKSLLLPTLRATIEPDHLCYLDACYILSTDEAAAPLLGSGGNDGSRDFGVNFAECLNHLFRFDDGSPEIVASTQIKATLFAQRARMDSIGSIGQFNPGQGGANASTGFDGTAPFNSWDVVLAMEGTLVFAGSLTRRWGDSGGTRAAFPFTFESVRAGAGGFSSDDPNRPRGEVWTPLWRRPAAFSEVAAVFAEGRLTLGRRTAGTGLDAARSITRIGQSRGISGFERYSLIQPDKKMPYQATPLGRFNVPERPRTDLVEDLEAGGWLERARGLASGKSAPAYARSAMRALEDALFQMTDGASVAEGSGNALIALGRFVQWLAKNSDARENLGPPPLLSPLWATAADDGSPEFRVAVSLAGLGLPSTDRAGVEASNGQTSASEGANTSIASPMAGHFVPINEGSFFDGQRMPKHRRWADSTTKPSVVWRAGSLVSNMISVLEWRLIDAGIRGLDDKPVGSATQARLADIVAFLSDDFDDAQCAAFLAGLIWARPTHFHQRRGNANPLHVPFAYAALKPLFTPERTLRSMGALAGTARLPIPPGMLARLRAGGASRDGRTTDEVTRVALARARASGLPSPFDPALAGGRRSGTGAGHVGAGLQADRLAAALLIPIADRGLRRLLDRAYPDVIPEHANESPEDN